MEMAKRSPTPNLDSSDDEDVGNEEAKRVRTAQGMGELSVSWTSSDLPDCWKFIGIIPITGSESDRLLID